ncbi:unnamed protein product [Oppiella nova]|uniref:Uncharacterized protein n=1 Tax=Oppiella nova TaxID=334625 RepID=A0A7R9M7F9_9ACAR|nr:unnamed protein product [Oppiella nova]CAG2172209.1 unnamed protein product [Oppiella nova]
MSTHSSTKTSHTTTTTAPKDTNTVTPTIDGQPMESHSHDPNTQNTPSMATRHAMTTYARNRQPMKSRFKGFAKRLKVGNSSPMLMKKTMAPMSSRILNCKVCLYSTRDHLQLTRHMLRDHSSNEPPIHGTGTSSTTSGRSVTSHSVSSSQTSSSDTSRSSERTVSMDFYLNSSDSERRPKTSHSLSTRDVNFEVNDVVWAKCKGFPWYPAIVVDPNRTDDSDGIPVPSVNVLDLRPNGTQCNHYLVNYFDAQRLWQWLPRNMLEPLGVDTDMDLKKLKEVPDNLNEDTNADMNASKARESNAVVFKKWSTDTTQTIIKGKSCDKYSNDSQNESLVSNDLNEESIDEDMNTNDTNCTPNATQSQHKNSDSSPSTDTSMDTMDTQDLDTNWRTSSPNECKDMANDNSMDFECNECRQLFDTKLGLEIHVNRVHRLLETYVCSECLQEFLTSDQISRHISEEHCEDVQTNRFSCQLCDHKCDSIEPFMTHMTTHLSDNNRSIITESHTNSYTCDGQLFRCNSCDFKSIYRQSLGRHILRVHSNTPKPFDPLRPFECNICGKGLKNGNVLKQHKREFHTSQRHAFKCQLCSYATYRSSYIIAHMSNKHRSAVRDYVSDHYR